VQAWTPPGRALAGANAGLLQRFVRGIDAWLRGKQDFIEYSASPMCMLRVVISRAESEVTLSEGTVVHPGDPIIDLHFWNERVPQTDANQGLAWGRRFGRQLTHSIAELAAAIDEHPRLRDAVAVRGRLSPSGERDEGDAERFGHRWGFEYADHGRAPLLRRLHDSGEDLWLLALAWTFNPGSLRSRSVVRRRDDLWISRTKLIERYTKQRPPRRADP
jgi:hypothetical protein